MLKFVAAASVLSGVASGLSLGHKSNYEPKLMQAVKMSKDSLAHGGPLPAHDHKDEDDGTNVWFQVS
jgi:hypothetical protein